MEEEYGRYTIAVYPCKLLFLPFGQNEQANDQPNKKKYDQHATCKTPFFAHGTKDIVGLLFWDKIAFGLRSLGPTFS